MRIMLLMLIICITYACKKEMAHAPYGEDGLVSDNFSTALILTENQEGIDVVASPTAIYALGNTSTTNGSGVVLTKWSNTGELIWHHIYTNATDASAGQLLLSDNHQLIVSGTTTGVSGTQIWMLKCDTSGNLLQETTFGDVNDEKIQCTLALSDGNVLVGGYSNGPTTQSRDILLTKVDANTLLPLWSKSYGGINQDGCMDVVLHNNEITMLCFTYSYGAGDMDFYLLKTNGNGDSLWSNTFGTAAYEEPQSLLVKPDNGLLLAGHSAGLDPIHDVYVVSLDDQLQFQNENWMGNSGTHQGGQAIVAQHGHYRIAMFEGPEGASSIELYDIEAQGNLLSTVAIAPDFNAKPNAACIQNGKIVVCGTETTPSGGTNLLLLKSD